MFLNGENIYPYYLYPPPSILLFAPMTLAGDAVGRVIWAVLNFAMFLRLLSLLMVFCESWLKKRFKDWQLLLIIMISIMGMIDHNIQLGQMTIAMLWISLEFCRLLNQKKESKAAFLLAVGIILKIIPGIFILWLFVKKKYFAIVLTTLSLLIFAMTPAMFNGQFTNQTLWLDWITTVNPFGQRFGVESGVTVISLNSFFPTYLSESSEVRNLLNLDALTIAIILNLCRIGLFVFLWKIYCKAGEKIEIFEIAFTLLISVLVFPHQMKYSMLLFTPAMILILLNLVRAYKSNRSSVFRISNAILVFLFLIFALYGRDTIGDTLVEMLDTSKYFTWLMIIVFIKLYTDESKLSRREQHNAQLANIC